MRAFGQSSKRPHLGAAFGQDACPTAEGRAGRWGMLCSGIAAMVLYGCASNAELPRSVARQILQPDSARRFVEFLASDELQGRNTPSPELLRAAEYIAEAFRRWGIQPLGGSYFHWYELVRLDVRPESLWVRIRRGTQRWEAQLPRDAVPLAQTRAGQVVDAPVVFVGSLAAEPRADERLRGAVALLVGDTGFVSRARLEQRIEQLRRLGAAAVLLVQSPERLERQARVLGYPWPALSRLPTRSSPLQPRRPDTIGLPAYTIGRAAVEALFGSLDAFHKWLRAQDTAPPPEPLPDVRVDLSVALRETERVRVPNVVGWLPGRRAQEEYILLGAHYDHVGTYSRPGEQDSIYNGADDNASGTAGMLLIARALALGRVKPLRSILFVAFSGEEKGLLGSQAFIEAPPLPLSGCRAMLNLDMIGRNHPDSLYLGWRDERLAQLVQEENRRLRRPFLLGELGQSDLFLASDHASFARRGIPVVFFFTGLHEDYHRPSDHAERLDYDKLTRVALLAARLLWRLAQVSVL